MLQRKTEDGEYVEVSQLGPSDYFGKLNVCIEQMSRVSESLAMVQLKVREYVVCRCVKSSS